MVVKTFRGQLADGGQDHIRLQTIKGKVGYRIIKFQVVGAAPGSVHYESVTQIWKKEQSSAVATIDFTDSDLLGIGLWSSDEENFRYGDDMVIIFDSEVFNQDIYITHQDLQNNTVNYYLELEVIPLTDHDAEFTTLKDIRGRNTT